MQNNHEHVTATEALKQDFAEWRKTRRPRSRIPEDLWARAAEMAAEIGIHKTARALRLDYTALKKRVVVDTPVLAPSDAAFRQRSDPIHQETARTFDGKDVV